MPHFIIVLLIVCGVTIIVGAVITALGYSEIYSRSRMAFLPGGDKFQNNGFIGRNRYALNVVGLIFMSVAIIGAFALVAIIVIKKY